MKMETVNVMKKWANKGGSWEIITVEYRERKEKNNSGKKY